MKAAIYFFAANVPSSITALASVGFANQGKYWLAAMFLAGTVLITSWVKTTIGARPQDW